jgi:hypothetical protein
LVATVIGSTVIPTAIANAWFMPRHLLPERRRESRSTTAKESAVEEPVEDLESYTGGRARWRITPAD